MVARKWCRALIDGVVVPEAGIDGAIGCGHGRRRQAIHEESSGTSDERRTTVRR